MLGSFGTIGSCLLTKSYLCCRQLHQVRLPCIDELEWYQTVSELFKRRTDARNGTRRRRDYKPECVGLRRILSKHTELAWNAR